MKNKLLTIVTCMMLASLCTFGLTACGGHEHAYTDVVTPPTCTEQGFTTHTCECGDVKVDTYVNATGHTWVAADCDTKRTCSVCGTTDGEPLGHSFTTYTSNNDATCLADGTKTATCSREGCNETETITDVGSKLSHSYANYVYNNDAKCGVDGTETGTCTTENCGATDTRTKAGTALSHVFTTYTYNNDAKCGVDGTETATCDRDDCDEHDTRTKAGTALSHDYEGATYVSNGDATCLADGTKSAVCNHGCGTKDTVADVGSKVDHKFTNYVSNGDATYLADGTKTAKCDYDCKTEDTVADVGSQLKSTLTIVFGNGTENLVINALAGTAIDAVENPTKTGHTFAGWSAEIPATLAAGENTITANWTINQYTLTIVFGNGDSDLVLTQDYDSDIDAIEDPTRNNYIFTGWSATIPTKMPAESLTITAGWTMDISGDPIASVTGYVSDEDDVLVLDTMTYGPDLFADAMVGDVVLANTDYSWNENKLVFTQEFIDQYLGTYQDVYVITNTSDLVYVEMLFADKVLNDAADVQEAFVYGAQALGDTFGKKEGTYVLGADIDMTGVTINNKAIAAGQSFDYYTDNGDGTYTKAGTTATAADFGFAGILDGKGHSISNITVSLVNHSLGQPIVAEDGTKAWKNASSFGL
ncbi:MAG: InlB B-repeat-containing protein, partial [Clostridia bacterium]|nr:InlB B-repeat-containing protein [Clostridia bacterium]